MQPVETGQLPPASTCLATTAVGVGRVVTGSQGPAISSLPTGEAASPQLCLPCGGNCSKYSTVPCSDSSHFSFTTGYILDETTSFYSYTPFKGTFYRFSTREHSKLKQPLVSFYLFIYLFIYLGPHPQHMEVPRLGVKSELQVLAYTTATAMPDLNRIYDLCDSLWQCWSEARD